MRHPLILTCCFALSTACAASAPTSSLQTLDLKRQQAFNLFMAHFGTLAQSCGPQHAEQRSISVYFPTQTWDRFYTNMNGILMYTTVRNGTISRNWCSSILKHQVPVTRLNQANTFARYLRAAGYETVGSAIGTLPTTLQPLDGFSALAQEAYAFRIHRDGQAGPQRLIRAQQGLSSPVIRTLSLP